MSKIICDICGTRYPDTAEQCPICGFANGAEPELEQEVQEVFEVPSRPAVPGGRFSKANVRKRNRNQPVYEEPEVRTKAAHAQEQEHYEEEAFFEENDNKKGGKILNVLLVIVIVALLGVSAYIFLEFFMPNFADRGSQDVPNAGYVEQTEAPTEAPTQAQEPTEPQEISCEQLILEFNEVTLHEAGEVYLLNVQVLPEGTTDGIMYISSNEEVATVNEEGRVTAIGEGSVVISILCGDQLLECNVTCDFAEEATEAPEEEAEAPTEPGVTKTVTSKTLNIRSDAGTAYDKVGQYVKGDQIVIYEEKTVSGQKWGRTDKGWVCMDYVK